MRTISLVSLCGVLLPPTIHYLPRFLNSLFCAGNTELKSIRPGKGTGLAVAKTKNNKCEVGWGRKNYLGLQTEVKISVLIMLKEMIVSKRPETFPILECFMIVL